MSSAGTKADHALLSSVQPGTPLSEEERMELMRLRAERAERKAVEPVAVLIKTLNDNQVRQREPWLDVVSQLRTQKSTVHKLMREDTGGEWAETIHAIADMIKSGELTPREVMLLSVLLPDVTQEARSACLWFLARPRWHEQWLRLHNLEWLETHGTALELDKAAKVATPFPMLPMFMHQRSEAVVKLNRHISEWAPTTPLSALRGDDVQGGGPRRPWLTYAERRAREVGTRVKGGAPYLQHTTDANGAAVTEAAPVAEVLAQYQYNQQQLQQQVERLGAQMSGLQVPAQPDVHAHQMQQQLGLITQMLQQIAPAPASTQLYKPPPRKRQSGHPPQQRQTRVRGAGAGDDDQGGDDMMEGNV